MTNIPKLTEEAMEKAADIIRDMRDNYDRDSLWIAQAAITAFCSTIAQGISEEDERKAFEEWLGCTYAYTGREWKAWAAALRACPYRAVVCGAK